MKNAWIETRSGKHFNPLLPDPKLIDIEDIAHALSMICRFTGHCREFYSVAQHSVLVSERYSPDNKLAGLLHDASEAYLCDVSAPLKPFLPDYKQFEHNLTLVVLEKFGISQIPKEVKEIDRRLCFTEARDLGFRLDGWGDVKPYERRIWPWTQDESKKFFLFYFQSLTRNGA